MGSDNDWKVMSSAVETLKEYGVDTDVHVASAHRVPDKVQELSANARANGFSVIIAGAGAAAHLAGVFASKTTLPVIGVPLSGTALQGVDALYAVVQMPSGVPVATVAIDGARNAALLAIQILATSDERLAARLSEDKQAMYGQIAERSKKVRQAAGLED